VAVVMKIGVRVGARVLTYETDLDLKVGDLVELPPFPASPQRIPVAEVVALDSDFDGPCKRVEKKYVEPEPEHLTVTQYVKPGQRPPR
jgi:hypothetical protein